MSMSDTSTFVTTNGMKKRSSSTIINNTQRRHDHDHDQQQHHEQYEFHHHHHDPKQQQQSNRSLFWYILSTFLVPLMGIVIVFYFLIPSRINVPLSTLYPSAIGSSSNCNSENNNNDDGIISFASFTILNEHQQNTIRILQEQYQSIHKYILVLYNTILSNKECAIYIDQIQQSLYYTYMAILNNGILILITMKHILYIVRYICLRIIFPNGTIVLQQMILPQLYQYMKYICTIIIQYHVQLTNEQILLEILLILLLMIIYYIIYPYIQKLYKKYQPIQTIKKKYTTIHESIQKWYNRQIEILVYSSRQFAIMTPILLYCWMIVFIQLLPLSYIVSYLVLQTNCNTILSIYLPILLSIIELYNSSNTSTSNNSNSNTNDDTGSTDTDTDTAPTSNSKSKKSKVSIQQSPINFGKENDPNNASNSNSSSSSYKIKRSSRRQTTVAATTVSSSVSTNNDTTTTTTTASSSSGSTNHNNNNNSNKNTYIQCLLQYWIVIRMMACMSSIVTQSIPYIIRKFITLTIISSSTMYIIQQHFEFYLYISIYMIPQCLTPISVEKMIDYQTLVQYIYIDTYIYPTVKYIYTTILNSISVSIYTTYLVQPLSNMLLLLSHTPFLSNGWYQYMIQLLHHPNTPLHIIFLPGLVTFLIQYYPIQHLCIMYIAYILPIYKCCYDCSSTNTSTSKSHNNNKDDNTTTTPTTTFVVYHQWLQYWIIQTIVSSILQYISSILYWIPFSSVLVYSIYTYLIVSFNTQTISNIYTYFIQNEVQYIIDHYFPTVSSSSSSSSKSLSSSNTNENKSHIIQLWNYILDRVPKATIHDDNNIHNNINNDDDDNDDDVVVVVEAEHDHHTVVDNK